MLGVLGVGRKGNEAQQFARAPLPKLLRPGLLPSGGPGTQSSKDASIAESSIV